VINLRKICVINQKGGVGKTTTTINIAAGLSRNDKKVLVIDFDAQGNIATSLNIENDKDIYDILTENADIGQCAKNIGKNLDIILSKESLTKTEVMIAKIQNKEKILKTKLKNLTSYDYVLIDCPPSLGLLNQNALLYAQEAFIPVSTDYLGYDALLKMEKVIEEINLHFKHNLKITKVIPTLFDKRNKTCIKFLDKITSQFYEITSNPIRVNSKIKEAPAYGKSIFSYAKSSRGAKDYMELVKLILNEEKQVLSAYSKSENIVPLNDPRVLDELRKKVGSNA
jgi:chromosome partitioning protein|tara:strand:+ start:1149 stop:1997 length:849 start_codon:yes stop_codon:yes gene_type:complete